MKGKNSVVHAFAVSSNRIEAVGTSKFIKTFIGPSTKVIDARGRLVLPGFNDAHVHFMAIGNSFSTLNLGPIRSRAAAIALISNYTSFLPDGRWLLGSNWRKGDSEWPERVTIDAVSRDNPVFLYPAGGDAAFANTHAFRLARLSDDDSGVDRDATGAPTGIVRGHAMRKIAAAVPTNHTRNWLEIAETATNYAASLGVTSVQDMHSDDSRAIYRELERQGKLKTRIYDCLPLTDWQRLSDTRLKTIPGDLVKDGCLKSFSDGDEDSRLRLTSQVIKADRAGLQIMVHAIGESANKIVLDVFEETAKTNSIRDRRFRVEHAHKVHDDDLLRFHRSLVIASMQPYLFNGSSESRYGTLLRRNSKVAFGSDASMVDLNPILGIHAAVNAGSESVSVYEAVRAYTVGSAYAEFQEKAKGTLEKGKLADFVVLSDDIFSVGPSAIRDVRVLLTATGGRVVYEQKFE